MSRLPEDSWVPPGGETQQTIWPARCPVLAGGIRKLEDEEMLASKPTTNISNPTYTIYQPKQNPSCN